jgi:hypothetical protein
MIENFKALPFGVQVATIFLFAICLVLFVMAPMFMVVVCGISGLLVSILRIIHYLETGE